MPDAYAWLSGFLEARQRLSTPFVVSDFLPPAFDRYFFIEWCYGIIDDFPFEAYPDDVADIDNLNRRHELERQFGLFLKDDTEHLYRPASIREIAERFNVPYSIRTTDEIPQTPGVRIMPSRTEAVLSRLITTLQGAGHLYLYVEDAERYSGIGTFPYGERNIMETAEEYFEYQLRTGFDSYSYLFPADHRWCLVTLEDLPYFIFGCDEGTAGALSTFPELEYFEITAGSEVHLRW